MPRKKPLTKKGVPAPRHHFSKSHAKVYWPYLPLVLLLIGGLFLNVWQPLQRHQMATLAYATEMGRSALLSATNSERTDAGKSSLSLNDKLNAAAQSKAQDMVAKDYWSHNTPSGEEPWIFIDAQGYAYSKAGENLAYGFNTSRDTITGWMNSPSHKANMLDNTFTEVGFGFANSPNFVSTGEETIVVAMYAKPIATAPAPAPQPEPAPAPVILPAPQPQVEQKSTESVKIEEVAEPEPTDEESTKLDQETKDDTLISVNHPTNTDQPIINEQSTRITLLQQLTEGKAPWSAIAVSAAGLALSIVWLLKHYVLVRRFIIEGEHFVAHHPVLDLIVVSIIALAVYLTQSKGIIL